MDYALIEQANRVLSKCGGRPIIQDGVVVCLEKKFLMPLTLQPGATQNFVREITGEALWEMRAISCDRGMNSIVGARLQIQLPSGRFLLGGNGMDVGQFAWVGSYRYVTDPPEECEPGSKIQVSLSDYTGLDEAIAVNLLFEGCYKFYMKGGRLQPLPMSATSIPRYQGILNENILAPCWVGGYGPETPEGYDDRRFTYSSNVATIPVAGPLSTTLRIPIDATSDFVCRRLLFDISKDSGVTPGAFLGRIRTGSGFALNDDYIDLAAYLGGACWPHDWIIRRGDEVFIDIVLTDATGATNMTFQAHLEGARRYRL